MMTCIYCGRRGSRGFHYVTTASNDREAAEQVACANREACDERQAKAVWENARSEAHAFGFPWPDDPWGRNAR